MLTQLKSPKLFKRLETTMTYLMYDKSEMGRLYNGILRRSKVIIVDSMPSLSRAAVCMEGIKPTFIFTPEYFEEPLQVQIDILCHEMYHLILKHPILYRDLEGPKLVFRTGLPRPQHQQIVTVINLAADAVVNQRLRPEQVQAGWVLPERYGLEPHRDTTYYHAKFMEMFPETPPESGFGEGDADMMLMPQAGEPDGEPSEDATELEVVVPAAEPEGETEPILRAERAIQGSAEQGPMRQLHEGVQQDYGIAPDGQLANPHLMWKIGPEGIGNGITDPGLAEEAIRQVIAKAALALTPQQRGTLPGWLQQEIESALKPSRVPWFYTLRRCFARLGAMTMRKTVVRPNRHTGGRPGVRPVLKRKIIVAIDESCSVSDSWVQQFKSEIHHAWTMGVDVWVITHNSVVTSMYRYNGKNLAWGRKGGGTDHTEVIDRANAEKADLLVCMTDGYTGVAEGTRPKHGMKVAWVTTPDGVNPVDQDYCDFGFHVPIYELEEEAA